MKEKTETTIVGAGATETPTPNPDARHPKCHYCGETDGKHRNGCPVAIGKEADCKSNLCPGCTFRGRPCPGPKKS